MSRYLFVSNFYPPFDRGGYEKHCREIAEGLRRRGHEAHVLTSRFGAQTRPHEAVWRTLHLESPGDHYQPLRFFTVRFLEEAHNRRALQAALARLQPDRIVFWGMWNLSRSLCVWAESTATPVIYWIEDTWPAQPDVHAQYWELPANGRLARPLKAAAARVARRIMLLEGPHPPRFAHAACASQFLTRRLASVDPVFDSARVVRCGIDLQRFSRSVDWGARMAERQAAVGLRVIYVGALTPEKGVYTLIDALAHLRALPAARGLRITLSLVGTAHPDLLTNLQAAVAAHQLAPVVTFVGKLPTEALPEELARHDVLVFPSIIEEGFGRVLVEAMACGLAVVSSQSGGSREIVQDRVSGLGFEPGNADQLAAALVFLATDHDAYIRLAQCGQARAQSHFDLERMIAEFDDLLQKALA